MKKIVSLLLFTLIILMATPSNAKRIIQGKVFGADGNPVAGYRVRAYDSDTPSADDKMGQSLTNSLGWYSFQYRGVENGMGWDGPHSSHHTSWRPDIYIVVAKPKPGGGWTRVDQTGVRSNHTMAYDITQNFRIPDDGVCPYPAKFTTTNVWRGCSCPTGTYKRWLDYLKHEARCADGLSPKAQCENRNEYGWYGINNSHGICVKASNIYAVHRQAYYKYFQNISNGVAMESLPAWVITRYDSYYPNVSLADIRIGESNNTPSDRTAITDCKKIYFPAAAGELARIRTESSPNYFWLLHEIAHSDQCMGLDKGSFSTKRDKYADMWFSQLPQAIIISIMTDGIPVDGAIHDNMPMETGADTKAAQVINATGIGSIPVNNCPSGTFSTRDHRGCKCPNRTKKEYKGLFNEEAYCIGMRIHTPYRTYERIPSRMYERRLPVPRQQLLVYRPVLPGQLDEKSVLSTVHTL